MLRLHWIFFLVLTLLLPLAPAQAAERVLLWAEGGQAGAASLASPGIGASGPIQSLRAKALSEGSVSVIAGLRVPFAPEMSLDPAEARLQKQEIAAASAGLRSRFAAAIKRAPDSARSFEGIPFVALDVTPAELDRLASDPQVISITENMVLRAQLQQSTQLVRAPQAWSAGYTGKGQVVAVLDSGVDKSHPFLSGKVVSEACYSENRLCPGGKTSSTASGSGMPCGGSGCIHGTHVAGIAAGHLSSGLSGVAPGAKIIAIRVLHASGTRTTGTLLDLLAGLDRVYALRNDFTIAAVNLSLGFQYRTSSHCDSASPPAYAAIAQLKAAGIATIAASGNDGDAGSISFPACMSNVVSVGSVSTVNWGTCSFPGISPASTAADRVACYSNSAPILSLLAPGSPINSSIPGGRYATEHGTSMAAPHVAGAFAVIRDKQPDASVDDILAALRSTGKPVADYRSGRSTPRIDVKEALDSFKADDRPALTLQMSGGGRGTVSFSPAGTLASCTKSCSNLYAPGTIVTLTAAPGATATFSGWSGACSGTGPCTVTVSASLTVNAVFYAISSGPPKDLTLSRSGTGQGTVSMIANGETTQCGSTCTSAFNKGTMVRLTASPAYGSELAGWSGGCRGRKLTCVVRMTDVRAVVATINALEMLPLAYNKGGSGEGTVDISIAGTTTTCTANCATTGYSGMLVTLTAKPATGKRFGGWSGSCRGVKTVCSFRLRTAGAVTATFN